MACSISSPLRWLVAPTRVWGMAMDTAWHEVETQPALGVPELHPSLEQWSSLLRSCALAAPTITIWEHLVGDEPQVGPPPA